MDWVEKVKHIVLLALSDAVGDMDEYYLYFLIPITRYHCDGTEFVFGILLVGKEVLSFIAQPVSGWVVDITERYQHYTLFLAAVVQLLTAAVTLFFGQHFEIVSLVAITLGHKLSTTLTETSMWKCVKMRCQVLYGKVEEEKQEQVISFIGVNQHIWSNAYETAFLGAAFLFMYFSSVSESTFNWARWMVIFSIMIGDLLMVLIAALPVFFCFIPGSLFTPPHVGPPSARLSPTASIFVEDPSESEHAKLLHQEKSVNREEVASLLDEESNNTCNRWLKTVWAFVKEKFLALYYGRLAIHTILQAWMLYVFTEVVEYPMTFAEASGGGTIDCDKNPGECTSANFCGGAVKNLVEVSMLGDVTYTIGAIAYFLFLLKCPPRWFYSAVVPLSCIFFGLLMVSFWFIHALPHTVAFIALSVAIVGPTYLERYNFYFWMSVIDSAHFGFFYGIYGIGQNVLHLTVSLVLALFGKDIKSGSWEFTTLLIICISMMGCIFFYSSWFGWAYSSYFKKRLDIDKKDRVENRNSDEEEEEEEADEEKESISNGANQHIDVSQEKMLS